jgi:hypothetical protein
MLFFKRQSGSTEWLRRASECKNAAYRAFDAPLAPGGMAFGANPCFSRDIFRTDLSKHYLFLRDDRHSGSLCSQIDAL